MIMDSKDIIKGLYDINYDISKNSIIVIKIRTESKKKKLILLGKAYCQGFSLISVRKEKGITFFFFKKVQEPKLKEEKRYSWFYLLFNHPYCEYLTDDILSQIGPKIDVTLHNKYKFFKRMWYIYNKK